MLFDMLKPQVNWLGVRILVGALIFGGLAFGLGYACGH